MKRRLWPFLFFVCSALISNACGFARHIKTHPDPEVRIERMRQTLEELQSEEKASDQIKGEKGEGDDEPDRTYNSK